MNAHICQCGYIYDASHPHCSACGDLNRVKTINKYARNKYARNVSHLQTIDVYRVLELFEVTNPCLQHAVKKLLCPGKRGAKDQKQDVREAMQSLERFFAMRKEDEAVPVQKP